MAAPLQTPPPLHTWRDNSIIRMGDEGVPVRVIARTLNHPSGEVRETLVEAIDTGRLLTMPRDDWPPGSQRDCRLPDCVALDARDPTLISRLMYTFGLTASQSRLFAVLLKRPEATKLSLHINMKRDDRDDTEMKLVDVTVCKIRAKLRRCPYPELKVTEGTEKEQRLGKIYTNWGEGYRLDPEARKFVLNKLGLSDDTGSCRTETAAIDQAQDQGAGHTEQAA
jgi:hypothetical protein